jgi:hypothetical protein
MVLLNNSILKILNIKFILILIVNILIYLNKCTLISPKCTFQWNISNKVKILMFMYIKSKYIFYLLKKLYFLKLISQNTFKYHV